MGKIKVEIDIEELKKAISGLPENEKEALFFELNPPWEKALQKMEQEVIREDNQGNTVRIEDI